MSKIFRLVFLCASMVAFAGSAFAQAQPVRVGGLTCEAAPRVGFRCVFRSNATGRHYSYAGAISRIRLDVAVTGGRLFWGVFAATSHVGYGVLRGTYVGASGNVSFGLGLGANVLVGGSDRTISLQPLSIEGQDGANLALGVARLTLR